MLLNASPQHRKRPGQPRLPILDTQHPRIHLSRTRKYSQNRATVFKAINIISEQTLWRNNKAETVYTTVGQVSEQGYRKRARHAVRRFRQLLDDALAIGCYIDREVARGRYPKTLLHVDDLPEADQFAQGAWEHLPLSDLFESYTLDAPEFQPTTTFGDTVAITVALQSTDLKQPHKPVALNGHHLKFKAQRVGPDTFYLPTGVCRLRQGWRLFIRHEQGVWSDTILDEPAQSIDESLREAWIYFISQLRILSPSAHRLAPVSLQRCFTGIEGGVFLIGRRRIWRFQLRFSQKVHHGRRHNTTVRTWREDTLSDDSLRLALRHLAAMDSYKRHLNLTGSPDSLVTADTTIPLKFWPDKPVILLFADDLLYEIEQRLPT